MDENDDDRKLLEICHTKNNIATNPIIDWDNGDVWQYMRDNNIKRNPLYDMGFHRVGCVGCPMAGKRRYREFNMFPKYKQMYIAAFDRMVAERKRRREESEITRETIWADGESVFRWWMDKNYNPDQMELFNEQEDSTQ
jgi:phosphoadenosine phosphosulfate reductase